MIRLVWLDRFLAFLCIVLILFIVTMGWLISSEKKLSITFAADTVSQNVHEYKRPAVKAYSPAAASSTGARRMYQYIQNSEDDTDGIVNVATSNDASNHGNGYQWAASHNVTRFSDCDVLASDYIDGCRNYVEVNRYVSTAEPSLSL